MSWSSPWKEVNCRCPTWPEHSRDATFQNGNLHHPVYGFFLASSHHLFVENEFTICFHLSLCKAWHCAYPCWTLLDPNSPFQLPEKLHNQQHLPSRLAPVTRIVYQPKKFATRQNPTPLHCHVTWKIVRKLFMKISWRFVLSENFRVLPKSIHPGTFRKS